MRCTVWVVSSPPLVVIQSWSVGERGCGLRLSGSRRRALDSCLIQEEVHERTHEGQYFTIIQKARYIKDMKTNYWN